MKTHALVALVLVFTAAGWSARAQSDFAIVGGGIPTAHGFNIQGEGKVDATGGKATGLALTGGSLTTTDISQALISVAGGTTALAPATIAPDTFDVRFMGAKCDGTTNDAAAFNAAASWVSGYGGGKVLVPPGRTCIVDATLTLPANVGLQGFGKLSSILRVGIANLSPMIMVAGSNASILDLEIQAGPGLAADTAGAAIDMGTNTPSNTLVRNVYILYPCIGIEASGNTQTFDGLYVNGFANSGCMGMRLGHYTTQAANTDTRISDSTFAAARAGTVATVADADLRIEDSGGLQMSDDDDLFAKVGIQIDPGANQAVDWTSLGSSYYGDTNTVAAVTIDTASASATVQGVTGNGGWASSGGTAGVVVKNSGGGTVDGVHFLGMRFFNNAGNAFEDGPGTTHVSVDASQFCGTATGGNDVVLDSGASNIGLRDNRIGGGCDGLNTTPAVGIVLAGSNSSIIITGNDLTGPTTPITGTPTGDSIVKDNVPLGTELGTVADAASLSLGSYEAYSVTGSGTGITSIGGAWQGRRVTLFPAAALTFATGGASGSAICSGYTGTAGVLIDAIYHGCWYLK